MNLPTFHCPCCGLQQAQMARSSLCSVCAYHQSQEINQTAKRHREHEDMLRVRLQAARESAERATEERKDFGQKMHWALKSRDRAIKVLRQINDLHELRADGSCKCRKPKGCKVAEWLDDRGIQTLIRRVDDYEAEEQRREQLWRELQSAGSEDVWEDFLRDSAGAPRPRRDTGS